MLRCLTLSGNRRRHKQNLMRQVNSDHTSAMRSLFPGKTSLFQYMGNLRRAARVFFGPVAAGFVLMCAFVGLAAQQVPVPSAQTSSGPADPKTDEQRLGLTGPANPKLPSLFLVGDSTVRNGHGAGADGLWGWGAPIADLFDTAKINVVNRAIGGLSSHTYISAGHWDST